MKIYESEEDKLVLMLQDEWTYRGTFWSCLFFEVCMLVFLFFLVHLLLSLGGI